VRVTKWHLSCFIARHHLKWRDLAYHAHLAASEPVLVCVCVREREREKVCEREREKERERERERER
jgi:hypothetical protein